MLQLQVHIGAVFAALADTAHHRMLVERLFEVVAYLIADVAQLKPVILCSEGEHTLVAVAKVVAISAVHLYAVVHLLSVDVSGYAAKLLENAVDGGRQS